MHESQPFNPYMAPRAASESIDPQGPPPIAPLASRGDRFVGALIDSLLVGIPTFLVAALVGFFGYSMLDTVSETAFWLINFLAWVAGCLVFLAIQGYLLANYGQTVGKRVVGTQIRGNDDRLLSLSELLLKRYLPLWLLSALPHVGSIIGIINALAIFRSNHKCLHDDLAGTKVIKLT